MNDEVERLLDKLTPHNPSSGLRMKILDAVDAELTTTAPFEQPFRRLQETSRVARWERRIGWASVLGLLAAVGMNVLVYRVGATRLESFQPIPPVPRAVAEVTESIESITDSKTADWFRDRFLARRRKPRLTPASQMEHYQRLLEQITVFEKDLCDVRNRRIFRQNSPRQETLQETPFPETRKIPEMDRDRSGRTRDGSSYYQRGGGLDHRFTS